MTERWQPIASAPMDGSPVWVRRMHEGCLVTQGWAVYDLFHQDAAYLKPMERDPLNRLREADYQRDRDMISEVKDKKRWLKPDRMYAFPEPTHWKPQS